MIKTNHIQIQCPEYGHTENVQDDDFVKCNQCKFEVMLCELKVLGIEQAKEVVIPEVKKEIEKTLKKAFKGFK